MGEAIFLHDEGRNHIYNGQIIHAADYRSKGNSYFEQIDGEFGIGFVSGNNVVLARDWIGAVPFHYIITRDGDVISANDVRALMSHPDYDYGRIRAVKAGHVVTIPLKGRFTEKDVQASRYVPSLYELPEIKGSIEQYGKALRENLVAETEKRLSYAIKDGIPVAIAFSGGMDSFSVALAINELGRIADVEAFCINTDGQGSDWPNAQRAANSLGLKLHEVRASKQRTLEVVPEVIRLAELYHDYDIFCAVSCYLLGEEMKKRGVRAVFTGDGANEAFRDYTTWGCHRVNIDEIIESVEQGLRYLQGRKDSDPVQSSQQASGYAKSASRGTKVFPHFGIDTFNPFVAKSTGGYIARIPLKPIARLENGQPLWKRDILRVAFPKVPEELFPLKTRMQDGVGTTDVVCHIRKMDLHKHAEYGVSGQAKYGVGSKDSYWKEENPDYYTDLFKRYFDFVFKGDKSLADAQREWQEMLQDLELNRPEAEGWRLVPLMKQTEESRVSL